MASPRRNMCCALFFVLLLAGNEVAQIDAARSSSQAIFSLADSGVLDILQSGAPDSDKGCTTSMTKCGPEEYCRKTGMLSGLLDSGCILRPMWQTDVYLLRAFAERLHKYARVVQEYLKPYPEFTSKTLLESQLALGEVKAAIMAGIRPHPLSDAVLRVYQSKHFGEVAAEIRIQYVKAGLDPAKAFSMGDLETIDTVLDPMPAHQWIEAKTKEALSQGFFQRLQESSGIYITELFGVSSEEDPKSLMKRVYPAVTDEEAEKAMQKATDPAVVANLVARGPDVAKSGIEDSNGELALLELGEAELLNRVQGNLSLHGLAESDAELYELVGKLGWVGVLAYLALGTVMMVEGFVMAAPVGVVVGIVGIMILLVTLYCSSRPEGALTPGRSDFCRAL